MKNYYWEESPYTGKKILCMTIRGLVWAVVGLLALGSFLTVL